MQNRSKNSQTLDVEGRKVTVTNLDKVLYPSGFTKGEVIDYYIRISSYLLPHLAGRPVTLKRYPDGIEGKHFYEKDAPKFTPDWVRRFPVPRREGGKPIDYVVVDDLATLVWCANSASLELHPFLHRAPDINRPTAMVFDLDPGEGAGVLQCAEVAFLLKAALAEGDLQSHAKVSGSKGIQVYVPLNTAVSYEETQRYSHALAERLEEEHKTLIVSKMAKAARTKKVFIDWSQNADFKTTVSVYSLRAKAGTPYVSLPVTWKELETALKKRDASALYFDTEAALTRLKKTGELFSDVLTLKQKLRRGEKPAPKKRVVAKETPSRTTAPLRAGAQESSRGGPLVEAKFIEPMVCLATHALPEGAIWQYEVKWDGYRTLAIKSAGKVMLRSRNDNDFSVKYPGIVKSLAAMPDNTVIDGEVIALDPSGRPSFNTLQNYGSSGAPLFFYVFDVLILAGRDVMSEPLEARRQLLAKEVLSKLDDPIRESPVLDARLPDLIASVRAQGLEGLIAKRKNSRYEPGQRSGAWQKMRINLGQEFVIGGYTLGGKTFDALIFGYYQDDKLTYAARTRNGFTPASREQLFKSFKGLEIPECPFVNLPEKRAGRWGQGLTAEKMAECVWLKPVLVGQFEFTEWTPDDHLRHSRFVALREDKNARDVRRE